MAPLANAHLTPDDLDDLLIGAEAPTLAIHCETCSQCRRTAARDQQVVEALGALPALAPADGFADRLMLRLRRGGAGVEGRLLRRG